MLHYGNTVRNVAKQVHDDACKGVVETLAKIEGSELAEVLHVHDFEGRYIASRDRKQANLGLTRIVEAEHKRELTAVESLRHEFAWHEVLAMMRGRNAPHEEIQGVDGYRRTDAALNNLPISD